MSAKTIEVIDNGRRVTVSRRGDIFEARHGRVRTFGETERDAVSKLRFALRCRWDKRGNEMEQIFRETAT